MQKWFFNFLLNERDPTLQIYFLQAKRLKEAYPEGWN